MNMAKASQEEIDRAIELTHYLQATADVRNYETPYFPDTDEPFDDEDPKDLRKFYDEVRRLCPGLMRVTFGFQVLVDNACDPNEDTLTWKPGIRGVKGIHSVPPHRRDDGELAGSERLILSSHDHPTAILNIGEWDCDDLHYEGHRNLIPFLSEHITIHQSRAFCLDVRKLTNA